MNYINIKNTKKNIAFIDTETIGTIMSPDTCLPFDISIKWYDSKQHKVVKQKCYLVRPFINNKYVMGGSFSANKYDYYLSQISTNKDYFVGSVNAIMQDIDKYNRKYNIKVASAYNDSFDKVVIERLCKEFGSTNPFNRLQWLDLLNASLEVINSTNYIDFCSFNSEVMKSKEESKFVSPSGLCRATAESMYCYIIGDTQFKEHHTGLEDLNIEVAIYEYLRDNLNNSKVGLDTPKVHWSRYPKAITDYEHPSLFQILYDEMVGED